MRFPCRAWVAQLVEQRIENPRVGGSNPPPGTTFAFSPVPFRSRHDRAIPLRRARVFVATAAHARHVDGSPLYTIVLKDYPT
jgi:hypothetical protein